MTLDQIIPENKLNIAIIGAGIAGLTASISLAKTGANIFIFEQADALREVGTSLQLSPNATRILFREGLENLLRKKWIEPHSVKLADARSLRIITEIPVAELAKHWWGAPYAIIARADLQDILHQTVMSYDNCRLYLSSDLNFSSPNLLMADLTAKMAVKPDLIIGADGVWSSVRKVMPLTGHPKFTKHHTWRFKADMTSRAHLPVEIHESSSVHVLMGASNHTVIYPADHEGNSNIVFVTRNKQEKPETIDLDKALSRHTFHIGAIDMLKSAQQLGCWSINQISDGTWTNGRDTILIGDAAHAMVPFMAQGAAMAIEDAYVLSSMLTLSKDNLSKTLYAFEKKRKNRIGKIKNRATFNSFSYHAIGPIKWGRDLILSHKSSTSFGRNLDWLYAWKPDE